MSEIIDTANLSDEEFKNFDISQLADIADKDEVVIEDEADNLDDFESEEEDDDAYDEQEELEDGSEEEDLEDEAEASEEETEEPTTVLLSEALAPMKVAGKERKIRDLAHLRSLASQGMDYSRKLQELNQSKSIIKTLEQAKITQDDLNYLIDLKNKDPKAIAKLIEDSEIDPLDLDSGEEYTPNQHAVSSKAIELEEVIESIRMSGSADEFNSVVDSLDAKSVQFFRENPSKLRTLNQHIQDGVYDKVMDEVDYLRHKGQLQGIPDYEAYQQVGDMMVRRGDFEPKRPKANPLAVGGGERKSAPKQKRIYKDKKQAGTVRGRPNQAMSEAAKLRMVQEASDEELPALIKKLKLDIN